MGRMKNYYEFAQLLHELEIETLRLMLNFEPEEYKRQLIQWEIDDRDANRH